MSVAETSKTVYHNLIDTGKLTKRQAEVMAYMQTVGTVTRRQIADGMDWDTGSVAGRVCELVAMNKLEEFGTTKCPKFGNTVGLVRLPKKEVQLQLI